uniref:EamA domain-containing protein n=1 Tax=Haptolina brevifila TaxID=156173 RepID=A0A7S2CUX7_9EUKA
MLDLDGLLGVLGLWAGIISRGERMGALTYVMSASVIGFAALALNTMGFQRCPASAASMCTLLEVPASFLLQVIIFDDPIGACNFIGWVLLALDSPPLRCSSTSQCSQPPLSCCPGPELEPHSSSFALSPEPIAPRAQEPQPFVDHSPHSTACILLGCAGAIFSAPSHRHCIDVNHSKASAQQVPTMTHLQPRTSDAGRRVNLLNEHFYAT